MNDVYQEQVRRWRSDNERFDRGARIILYGLVLIAFLIVMSPTLLVLVGR